MKNIVAGIANVDCNIIFTENVVLIDRARCTRYGARCVIYTARYVIYSASCVIYTARYVIYSASCAIYTARYVIYSACCLIFGFYSCKQNLKAGTKKILVTIATNFVVF
jgi:hypothetical protein